MRSESLAILLFLASFHPFSLAGTFKTALRVPVGTRPSAVAVGDFNQDGNADVIVANNGDSSVQLLLGNGNGTFRPQSAIPVDAPPVSIVIGDFNGDKKLDLAVLTTDIFILLGNGDGTFSIGGIFSPGGISIATADFNGEGKLDLVVTDGYQGVMSYLERATVRSVHL